MRLDSFLWHVELRKDRKHSLKNHARRGTAIYELLGCIDLLAEKHPKRFVFASQKVLFAMCNKGARKDGQHYSTSHLKAAFAEIRARRIASQYFKTWDGRLGFIVAPHDALCQLVGKVCTMRAPREGEYECTTEELAVFKNNRLDTGTVPAPYQSRTKTIPKTIPEGGIDNTQNHTQNHTGEALESVDAASVVDYVSTVWNADGLDFGAPNRGTGLSVRTGQPKEKRKNRRNLKRNLADFF
jgi:hypothetical protein